VLSPCPKSLSLSLSDGLWWSRNANVGRQDHKASLEAQTSHSGGVWAKAEKRQSAWEMSPEVIQLADQP